MDIPDIAIAWLTQNASSNVELARLSNINRRCRYIVALTIIRQQSPSLPESDSQWHWSLVACAPLLLLPSMVKRILLSKDDETCKDETFCAAWFHPMGIQIQPVPPLIEEDENEGGLLILSDPEETPETPASFTDNGLFGSNGGVSFHDYQASEGERTRRSRSPASTTTGNAPSYMPAASYPHMDQSHYRDNDNPNNNTINEFDGTICCHEWRGYCEATDVLQPFGYAAAFVDYVIQLAVQQAAPTRALLPPTIPERKLDDESTNPRLEHHHQTTYAVRGATFARPEGYCLCWDVVVPEGRNDAVSLYRLMDSWESLRRQEYVRSILVRNRRRRMLQREALPRVVLSSAHKHPLDPTLETIQQPCLQFLNATGSQAVRLLTPPFACGPLQGPVTLLCVGIATEDGCFVSGLQTRFEMGHMYPVSPRDALIDRSPVCIATDRRRVSAPTNHSENHLTTATTSIDDALTTATAPTTAANRMHAFSSEHHVDSDDSSCGLHRQVSREGETTCDCPFGVFGSERFRDDHHHHHESNDDDEDDQPLEECIHRGQRGPGSWHCYIAIFDGDNSEIRIDGIPEVLQQVDNSSSTTTATTTTSRTMLLPPALEGLTIGSDHAFDMSLCLGDGSNDESEGAIAELAVFQGRMDVCDIEHLERYIMTKHGIVPTPPSSLKALTQVDEWTRQARALIVQPPPWTMVTTPRENGGIPLRVVAKDKSVAWHRTSPVTGEDLRVYRIGSKFSNGSSDW